MEVKLGDQIVVEAEKVGQGVSTGTVEEVLAEDPPRLRIHWGDGHTTVFIPTAGAAEIKAAKQKPAQRPAHQKK